MSDQQTPQPGDRVRVTRTRTEVFEGVWQRAEDESESGHHAIVDDDGTWIRVRDQGPITFRDGWGNDQTEEDAFEIIETADPEGTA